MSPSAESQGKKQALMDFTAWWSGDKANTFKPRRGHRPGTKQFLLHQHAERTLGGGDLRQAVALPEGEDINEWLAVKAVDLFNEVCLVHGMLSDFCTEESCSKMTAGSCFEYKWADGVKYKTPTTVSAPKCTLPCGLPAPCQLFWPHFLSFSFTLDRIVCRLPIASAVGPSTARRRDDLPNRAGCSLPAGLSRDRGQSLPPAVSRLRPCVSQSHGTRG